jgi:hypothetical protein
LKLPFQFCCKHGKEKLFEAREARFGLGLALQKSHLMPQRQYLDILLDCCGAAQCEQVNDKRNKQQH